MINYQISCFQKYHQNSLSFEIVYDILVSVTPPNQTINKESVYMEEKLEEKLKTLKKMSSSGEEYLLASDIPELINANTPSISTFRRRVNENAIHIVSIEGQKEDAYSADDVTKFLQGELNLKRGGVRRGKKLQEQDNNIQTGNAKNLVVRPLAASDVGDAYSLLFNQLGFENAVQPTSLYKWVQEGLPAFWVVQDSKNSRKISAVLGVLPLDEELIIRFMRGEFTLQEIAITDVLSYQPDHSYTCYIIAATDPVCQQDALIQVINHLLSYWCEQYPQISIRMLYISTPTNTEESPILRMIKSFFFSRRRDISVTEGVWELPLDEFNPTPTIQQFQKCIKEKNMLILEDRPLKIKEKADPPFDAKLQYRRAETREDIATLVQIGAEIFVPPGVQPSISNAYQTDIWYSWLMKNPEIFHVVTIKDKIIGYISMIPLHQNMIDKIMKGAHPTTITPDDVLMFSSDEVIDIYVHIWGTTPRLTETQKREAGATMLRELKKTFYDFARRGVDIRDIYTRSNKEDGIGISVHIGFEDLYVPGVTDAPNLADRKRVLHVNTAKSTNSFMMQYRQVLKEYSSTPAEQSVRN